MEKLIERIVPGCDAEYCDCSCSAIKRRLRVVAKSLLAPCDELAELDKWTKTELGGCYCDDLNPDKTCEVCTFLQAFAATRAKVNVLKAKAREHGLDQYARGQYALEIAYKLRHEDMERVPEDLQMAFKAFLELDEEKQYRVCYAVLGE